MAVDRLAARRHIAVAAFAGLVLRLAFGLIYWVDKPLTHDEHEYLALAANLAAGGGFAYPDAPEGTTAQFGRAPGYPLFLAAIGAGRSGATAAPVRVKVVQSALGALTVWLIALAALRAAGPVAGIVAAWLAAVYPPLVWISSYVFSESLYTVLALSTAVALQSNVDRFGSGNARAAIGRTLLAGALAGASMLVRPAMLFFLPFAIFWLVWRQMPRCALALLAGTVMIVGPWTLRNFNAHGRLVLIASEGGVTFWTGNHPLARGEGDLAANPDLKRAELEFRAAHPGLTAEQLEPLYYRDAFRHIAADPLWWAGLLARKAFYTVVPAGPSYALHSFRYRAASIVSYLLVLPFAVAGAVAFWRSPRRPTALLLLAGASGLASIVFFPQERFRIPVIDPVLIVFASLRLARSSARSGQAL